MNMNGIRCRQRRTAGLPAAAVLAALVLVAGGCAAAPAPQQPTHDAYRKPLAGSRAALVAAARSVLLGRGFALARSNDQAGVLATRLKPVQLSGEQADCGTIDGKPAVSLQGTRTRLAYNVWADSHVITIQAVIDGKGPDGKSLNCVSTGKLEQRLYQRIAAELAPRNRPWPGHPGR